MNIADILDALLKPGVLIILAFVAARIYKRRLAFKERELEIMARRSNSDDARISARNAELENRVRVLERIVTEKDSSQDIALQIEALRDHEPAKVTTQ